MFQLELSDLSALVKTLEQQKWPTHPPLREVWRRTGDRQDGQLKIFVQDRDGCLLMLNQDLGELPL